MIERGEIPTPDGPRLLFAAGTERAIATAA